MTMPRGSWMMVAVILVAQVIEAAPRDSGPPPEADLLEFLGSWHTEDDRWVDPFYVGEVPGLETVEHDSVPQQSEAAGHKQPSEKTLESSRKGTKRTDVTVPQKDVKP
jgi:hypothetical protein